MLLVKSYLPHVTYHVSCISCQLAHVTFYMSLTYTAIALDPPPAMSQVCKVGWIAKSNKKSL